MPDPAAIWSDATRNLAIRLQHKLDPGIESLLGRTVWGNRDLRYTIKNVGSKLERLCDPYFFSLTQDGELVAVCILNRRTTQVLGRPYDSCHFVMLATDDRAKGRGFAGLLSEQIRRYLERELRSPAVAYAYIEAGTDYSLRISSKVGHRFSSHLFLTLFSRFRPRDDEHIQSINEDDVGSVVRSLYDLYEDHVFLDFDQSLLAHEYYVLSREGEILAGAQAEVLSWSVSSMSGLVGWLALKVLPHIPWLGDLLPLHDFRLLRFGIIMVRSGYEAELPRLLEGLLARNDVRVGLILMDERSPVLRTVKRTGGLGPLNALFGRRAKVVADCKGATDEDIEKICCQPIVVSPLDVI
jgi:hypothetical protein